MGRWAVQWSQSQAWALPATVTGMGTSGHRHRHGHSRSQSQAWALPVTVTGMGTPGHSHRQFIPVDEAEIACCKQQQREGLELGVHFLSGCVAKINTPWP